MNLEDFPEHVSVKQSVFSTLAYFDLFDVPITREELKQYLLFGNADEHAINIYLKNSSYVHNHEGFLSFRWNQEFWQEWEQKQIRTRAIFKKVASWRWLLQLCPFIQLVTVCNSAALGDTRENSDIDLFVVAKPGRIFTARLALTVLTSLFGLRRYGNKIHERFCLSFYVTEEALDLSGIALQPYDIYLAFWLQSMQPIVGDYKVYEHLIQANNPWLKKFFSFEPRRKRYFRARRNLIKTLHWIFEQLLDFDAVERWCRSKQWSRAFDKYQSLQDKSGTVISDSMLKFHDKDARSEIREEWQKRVAAIR